MSHFTVAVFSDGKKTVEELLAPYQENNMGDCPKEYLKFKSATEEERERYENDTSERVVLKSGEMLYPWEDEKLKENLSYIIFSDGKDHSFFYDNKPEYLLKKTRDRILGEVQICFCLSECGAELRKIPFKELYQTLDEFVKEYIEAPYDEEQQDYGYWENPNAKWDWWQIGGRWKGFLKAKEGNKGESSLVMPVHTKEGEYAQARVRDIDFSPDMERYKKNARWWEVVIEGSELEPGEKKEDFLNFYKKEYLFSKYKTKENYAIINSSVITYAVIMPDGEWYQKGQMGWFGCGSDSADESFHWDMHFKENFIDKANPNWILTIVDCHI